MRTLVAAVVIALGATAAPAEGLRDPMRPPGADVLPGAAAGGALPVLEAIVIRPDLRYAVIDGALVRVGSRVGEARVTRIEATRVLLAGGAGVTELRLFPQVEKRTAAPARRPQGETR